MHDVERVVREYGRDAVRQLIVELSVAADALVDLAVERATTLGAAEYGDASFHKNSHELKRETSEELADAIFYTSVNLHKRE